MMEELSEERFVEVNRIIEVFSYAKVQALVTMSELLDSNGITMDEVKALILHRRMVAQVTEQENKNMLQQREELWKKTARHCPVCKKVLRLRKITEPKGKGNIKGYTSHWFCEGDSCDFEKYGYEDADSVFKQIMEGTYNADN